MTTQKKPVAFITGASSGIGAAVAKELAKKSYQLVLLARRRDRLKLLAEELENRVSVLTVEGSVHRSEDLTGAVSQAIERFGRIDLVLANAGFGVVGNFESLKLEDYIRQFETNIYGVLRTAWASFEALKATEGILGIVGSLNGIVSLPGSSPYGMSKHAMRSFAASLSMEWAKHGIAVTHLAPGFVQSEIFQVDNHGNWQAHSKDHVPGWLRVPTQKAAKEIVRALLKRKREAVITGHARVIATIHQHWPSVIPFAIRTLKWSAREEPKEAPIARTSS